MAATTTGLTVKGRIYGGFGTVLLLLTIVATVGFFGFSTVGRNVVEFAIVSDNTSDIQQIERDVVSLRRNAFVYTTNGDVKAAANVRALQVSLAKDITEAIRSNDKAELKANLDSMKGLFESYSAKFERIVALRAKRVGDLNDSLIPLGNEVRGQMTAFVEAATAERDFETATAAGRTLQEILSARLLVATYLIENDPKVGEEAKAQFVRAAQSLNQLANGRGQGGSYRRFVDAAQAKLPAYDKAVTDIIATITENQALVAEMGGIALRVSDLAEKTRTTQMGFLNTLKNDTLATVSGQKATGITVSAIALVLGLAFAYLIARSILTPITNMTHAMGELAGGKLDVTVPALERTDEIGLMAQAVQVFKQNAVDKKHMEEDAEAARIAKAQADSEQRAREASIVAEVAEVAKAASAGDLDRRIELAGKDGFLLSLCEGVNSLVHLTGIALKDVANVLASVAQGDLTKRITNDYDGVFGQLKGDVNTTADKLFEIVTNINSAAGQIGSAASEVAAGSQDLSERSEQQASALEETAASMEELAATVRQNAANAQQANQLAAGAREIAASGGQVVSEAVGAMARIETSSQKIEDIVGMIDEIAFQTNLLALNAAVEAARAGDAGKGFAVVAQEVRNLAQRSAQASKEIKTLIAESSTQVRGGADLVKGAGKTLDEILGSVKRVADIVAEIAAASTEQAAGIDQVNAAVSQMDEMTQQNAALVEESAAAAHALEEQSGELNRLMGFFHVGAENAPPPPKAAAKPVAKAPIKTAIKAKTALRPKPAAPAKAKASNWEEF